MDDLECEICCERQASSAVTTINDTLSTLGEFIQEKDKFISNQELKIHQWKKAIEEATKSIDKEKNASDMARVQISQGKVIRNHIEAAKQSLQNAKTKKTITKSRNDIENCMKITEWVNEVRDKFKNLNTGKVICAETTVQGKKATTILKLKDNKIYVHPFKYETPQHGAISVEFCQLQKMIPKDPSLVFLELSLAGVVKGRVHVRLDKDLPNIRANMVQLVTGQCGASLAGTFEYRGAYDIAARGLRFSGIPVTPDSSGSTTGKRGDVIGDFRYGYLWALHFFVGRPPRTHNYGRNCRVLGHIESGLDVVQNCYDNCRHRNVKITDCGLVIEQE